MDFKDTNFVILVIVATFWIQASSIRIELIQKTTVKMENQLTISCIADERPDMMMKPIVIDITRTGENPIATIEKHSEISLMDGLKSNYQVEGHFGNQDNKLNFLRLIITNPSMNDTGEYNCIIFFLDVTGEMKKDSARANLTVDNLDLGRIVHYLMDKMSTQQEVVSGLKDQNEKLQKQVDEQHNQNEKLQKQVDVQYNQNEKLQKQVDVQHNQNEKLQKQVDVQHNQNEKLQKQVDSQNKQLMEQSSKVAAVKSKLHGLEDGTTKRIQDLDQQVRALQEISSNQSMSNTDLVDTNKLTTAFSSAYKYPDKFNQGDVVLFRKVSVNLGNAYNQNTGVFTAPREGIYMFQLLVMCQSAYDFQIDIKANGKTVARTYAVTKDTWSQSSGHTVVRLSTGGTVKPVVSNLSGSNREFISDSPWSVFSGYLVTPL